MAIQIGTAHTTHASRLMLLGAGELGKEIAIEAQRLGLEVIAVDRYPGAPAMQVAHRAHVIDMLDGAALERVVRREQPALIVPEVEAIATEKLLDLEADGFHVVPSARATRLTMDREGIRRLAAEELGLPTSPYEFAGDVEACREAVARIGVPCVVKPVMSSSGKGQVVVQDPIETDDAWSQAVAGGRGGKARVIVEGFVEFDYEITLLTVRHKDGTRFCAPIGHLQVAGDYRESWQPQAMTIAALEASEAIATAITNALGGHGIFGVELFIRGDEVLFSEVSPRPHDTGMVTLVSQNLSEFSLHVRAILGFPINGIEQLGPSASVAILGAGEGRDIRYGNLESALAVPQSDIRIFGKPEVFGERRLGVALARGADVDEARSRALEVARRIEITISEGDTQS